MRARAPWGQAAAAAALAGGPRAAALSAALSFAAALLAAALLAAGCGEKITIPLAKGIPSSNRYSELPAWQLIDPTDVVEWVGKIFVLEGTPGSLTKYSTQAAGEAAATGLRNPVALAKEPSSRWLAVGEAGGAGLGGPRVSWFDRSTLEYKGSADLDPPLRSLAGIAASDSFVYVSDPDSGAVFRYHRDPDGVTLTPQGIVANDAGSRDSPNFVFKPAGLLIDAEGMLLIADSDTTRNWILRFDPTPPAGNPSGKGVAVGFRPPGAGCVQDLQALVLGRAPACGQSGFELGPSSALGEFHLPTGVTIDEADVQGLHRYYVVDRLNGRIQRFDGSGHFELAISSPSGSSNALREPVRAATWLGRTFEAGVELRFPGAKIFVVDRASAQIHIFEDENWIPFEEGG